MVPSSATPVEEQSLPSTYSAELETGPREPSEDTDERPRTKRTPPRLGSLLLKPSNWRLISCVYLSSRPCLWMITLILGLILGVLVGLEYVFWTLRRGGSGRDERGNRTGHKSIVLERCVEFVFRIVMAPAIGKSTNPNRSYIRSRSLFRVYILLGHEIGWIFFLFMEPFDRNRFLSEYLYACRAAHPAYTVTIFLNHAYRFDYHCAVSSDAEFLKQLGMFYAYCRLDGGIISLLTPKSLRRVDVVKRHGRYAGSACCTLPLGFIHYRQVAKLYGKDAPTDNPTQIVQMLKDMGVIERDHGLGRSTPFNNNHSITTDYTLEPEFALNFVEAWDSTPVLISILTPTILSIVICVTWPIVAVHNFEADVQISVQTGASVASYIVLWSSLFLLGTRLLAKKMYLRPSNGRLQSQVDQAGPPIGAHHLVILDLWEEYQKTSCQDVLEELRRYNRGLDLS
ncbi:hypothetical protein F5Y18DRAFT_438985 [Xylariaceae sp. FL1019]|nr:hypothetical protein F5Y18DRAFT_438985 [Xylariaceae sp. FL1019]